MDFDKVLIENLREAQRQIQRYLLIGLTASASLLLLQLTTSGELIRLPNVVPPVDLLTAKVILAVAHVVAGFMAVGTVQMAGIIHRSIKDDGLRKAARWYPNLLTHWDASVGGLMCSLPPLLFTAAIVVWAVTVGTEQTRESMYNLVFFGALALVFGVGPYVFAYRLSKELRPESDPIAGSWDLKEDGVPLLSKEKYDAIEDGMTLDQVRGLFPEDPERQVVKAPSDGEVYTLLWKAGDREIRVKFKGDKSVGKSRKPVVEWGLLRGEVEQGRGSAPPGPEKVADEGRPVASGGGACRADGLGRDEC